MLIEALERLIASLNGAVGRDGRASRIDPAVCGNRAITGDWKLEPDQFCAHFKREHAIETVLKQIPRNSFVVATTGKTGRELYELREKEESLIMTF